MRIWIADMKTSSDMEFAKILELLNALEYLDDDSRLTLLKSGELREKKEGYPSQKDKIVSHDANENGFAAQVASAMAKRDRC
jgi:hypothetical protein